MNILPERMRKTDDMSPEEAIAVIELYINYMCEQLDFSIGNIKKKLRTLEARADAIGSAGTAANAETDADANGGAGENNE